MIKKIAHYLILIVLLLGSRMVNSQPLTESKQLFSLINQRLSLMQAVAYYKMQHNLEIFVPAVESRLLETVASDAKGIGLPTKQTQAALQLQMAIGVQVQRQWIQQWQNGSKPNEPPTDLATVLRPAIKHLTHEIILQIAKSKSELADPALVDELSQQINQQIQVHFVKNPQKQDILQSLLDVVNA